MSKKILFLDTDGTLIHEPADGQADSFEKFKLIEGVIPALIALRDAGYRFVLVTNQDGLGGRRYPRPRYEAIQRFLTDILRTQGITFEAVLVCPHLETDG